MLNLFDVQAINMMGYPTGNLMPINNTTKKIQNYVFKLNEVLGKGNFSTVYRGHHELTNEPVAIKVVELSSIRTPALVDLLYSYIEILKTLNHPNILRCYEVFTSANNCYIITEMCTDGDLESRIKNRGPIPERYACKTIYYTFQGLKYLAEQSIVHRDFKIANVLFNKGVAKIADFGFAKRTRDRFKDINIGSPIYMSPYGLLENIYGPKTDVWAFGVFMFEILHGDTPLAFCQNEMDLKMHIMNPIRPEAFNPTLSADLRDLIRRCLEIHEQKRISIQEIYQSPFMRRIQMEMARGGHPLEMATHTKSGAKIGVGADVAPVVRMASLQDSPYNNSLIPPLQRGFTQINNLLSPDNRINSSPRVALGSVLYDGRKNLSFQNVNQNSNINNSRRGLSVYRTNHFHNLQPSNSNASSSSREPRNIRMYSLQAVKARDTPTSSNLQPMPFRIVSPNAILTFQYCVNLLHYCRLAYKVASILNKLYKYIGSPTKYYFINWLFHTFQEVEAKVPTQIKFYGYKAQLREKKLQYVISYYHKKYFKDLKISTPYDTTLQGVQQTIINLIRLIDEFISKSDNSNPDRHELIVAAHYLMFMWDTNILLYRCLPTSDYNGFMKKCNIEQFLSLKKENYDDSTYRTLKGKIDGILPR